MFSGNLLEFSLSPPLAVRDSPRRWRLLPVCRWCQGFFKIEINLIKTKRIVCVEFDENHWTDCLSCCLSVKVSLTTGNFNAFRYMTSDIHSYLISIGLPSLFYLKPAFRLLRQYSSTARHFVNQTFQTCLCKQSQNKHITRRSVPCSDCDPDPQSAGNTFLTFLLFFYFVGV